MSLRVLALPDKTPRLFSLYTTYAEAWSIAIRQMVSILFDQATLHPKCVLS